MVPLVLNGVKKIQMDDVVCVSLEIPTPLSIPLIIVKNVMLPQKHSRVANFANFFKFKIHHRMSVIE